MLYFYLTCNVSVHAQSSIRKSGVAINMHMTRHSVFSFTDEVKQLQFHFFIYGAVNKVISEYLKYLH